MPDEQYSIGELAAMAGVTPRTIRYYVSIGLLPSPGQAGPQTRYGEGHLARLRLIRKLQLQHLPLGEITKRLGGLDDEAVEQTLEAGEVREGTTAPGSALEYIRQIQTGPARPSMELRAMAAAPEQTGRTQWDRVALSQNVELHIRRPLGRLEQKRVERLIRIGREILEEGDQP